jgi:Protein of unknown function (DUF2490)
MFFLKSLFVGNLLELNLVPLNRFFCFGFSLLFLGSIPLWSARAQQYSHLALWTRLQVNAPLSKNWELATTLHWRRQNNYDNNKLNLLAEPLLTGIQSQLIRRNRAQTAAFIPIQINFFLNNTLLGRIEDFSVPQNREWRYSVGGELTQNITPKLIFRERVLQELRFLRSNQDRPVGRIRGRWQVNYRWKSFVSITGVTELIFHDPPQINNLKPFRFHQFWLGSGLLWHLKPKLNLETSYTFIRIQRLSLVEIDNQNVLNLSLLLRL